MEKIKSGYVNEVQKQDERSRASIALKEMKKREQAFMKNKVWKKGNHYTWKPVEKEEVN